MTSRWVSQGLRDVSEMAFPHPESVALADLNWGKGSLVRKWESRVQVYFPGDCFAFGLGVVKSRLERHPSHPSLSSLFVSLLGCLCLSLPLPHLPPPSTALQVKECKFPLTLSLISHGYPDPRGNCYSPLGTPLTGSLPRTG